MDGKPGITLISEDEVNVYQRGDSVIYYTRVSSAEQARIAAKVGTRRDGSGNIDEFNRQLCIKAIRGWACIPDAQGECPVDHDPATPPDPSLLSKFVARLPGAVKADLSNLTSDAKAAEDELLKN